MYLKVFFLAVMAGIMISIGGIIYLSIENYYIGASFFSIGLFFVATRGLFLYTGKVGYFFDKDNIFKIQISLKKSIFLSKICKMHS